jgi:hypothetical protein
LNAGYIAYYQANAMLALIQNGEEMVDGRQGELKDKRVQY